MNIKDFFKTAGEAHLYKKNDFLYHKGEVAKSLFFMQSGLVGLFDLDLQGKESLVRIFGMSQCFGHRSLVAGESYYVSAQIMQEALVWKISHESFLVLLKNSQFTKVLLSKLAKELKWAELRLISSSYNQVSIRVAQSLLFLKEQFPSYEWTRHEIACHCGSTTATVIKTMAKFEANSWIKQERRHFTIIDKAALSHFAGKLGEG